MTYTNATVQPLHSPWRADGLDWEIRGYIAGTWVNIPHRTEEDAKQHLAELVGA